MDAPPVGMRVGTSILALQKLHKMLLVPHKPVFPSPGDDARFARLGADGASNWDQTTILWGAGSSAC